MVDSKKILKLASLEPFGSGLCRHCFVHPEDSSKCVKVPRPRQDALSQYKRQSWLARLVKTPSYYDQNGADIRTQKRLAKLENEEAFAHIPRFFGAVQTDLGDGIVFELMRNFDGSIARTLRKELAGLSSLPEPLAEAIHAFKAFVKKGFIHPLHLGFDNIVNVHLSPEHQRLYIVDGMDYGWPFIQMICGNVRCIGQAYLKNKRKTFDARIQKELTHKLH